MIDKQTLGFHIRRRPRTSAAITFGCATIVVTHFSWSPDARMNGYIPVLTIAVGLCHALAGAITGSRLIDRARTKTSLQACVLGAGTSLLGIVLLAPPFALWVSATNTRPESVFSYLYFALLIGLFSFLATGWILLLVSSFVGYVLYRVSASQATNKLVT